LVTQIKIKYITNFKISNVRLLNKITSKNLIVLFLLLNSVTLSASCIKVRSLFVSRLKKKTLTILRAPYKDMIGKLQIGFRYNMFIVCLTSSKVLTCPITIYHSINTKLLSQLCTPTVAQLSTRVAHSYTTANNFVVNNFIV
jgi:hypothetical protein